jgi:hypothetical protein
MPDSFLLYYYYQVDKLPPEYDIDYVDTHAHIECQLIQTNHNEELSE